jgi:hypothetical protein
MEEETNRNVLWMVNKRNRSTLHALIKTHVAAGAIIKSDEWATYQGLNEEGFKHLTVNHSICFINEEGTHTQLIESCWSQVKSSLKQKWGTRKEDLAGYRDFYSFSSDARFERKTPFEYFFARIIKTDNYY